VPRGLVKLTKEDLEDIRNALTTPYYGINSALARKYNVSEKTIRKIRLGEYKI
jgi:hypothetical protein